MRAREDAGRRRWSNAHRSLEERRRLTSPTSSGCRADADETKRGRASRVEHTGEDAGEGEAAMRAREDEGRLRWSNDLRKRGEHNG